MGKNLLQAARSFFGRIVSWVKTKMGFKASVQLEKNLALLNRLSRHTREDDEGTAGMMVLAGRNSEAEFRAGKPLTARDVKDITRMARQLKKSNDKTVELIARKKKWIQSRNSVRAIRTTNSGLFDKICSKAAKSPGKKAEDLFPPNLLKHLRGRIEMQISGSDTLVSKEDAIRTAALEVLKAQYDRVNAVRQSLPDPPGTPVS